MEIIRLSVILDAKIQLLKTSGLSIGFVPTMGALHAGHLRLIEAARQKNDIVICSIFVNPTQFNNAEDLEKYPRTEEEDCDKLEKAQCDFVFIPTVEEVYPKNLKKQIFHFGDLENVMEGKFRPGHFAGVAEVVHRLFSLVKPNQAYFGLKDYQQFCIIQSMVKQAALPIEIIGVETVREPDGLAMSSRNVRLTEEGRKNAVFIFEELTKIKSLYQEKSIGELKEIFEASFKANEHFQLEYFEIADGESLFPLKDKNVKNPRAFVTAFIENIRLIDNISLVD